MSFAIRPAQDDDIADMTDLIFRSKASNGYDADFMEACRAELRVTPEVLRARRHWLAVDEVILGCIALGHKRQGVGEIGGMFVAPEAKGRGIGRALWQEAMEAARTIGFATVELDADPAAVPFYRKMGCRTVGEAPSGSIPGRMLPLMSFAL